MCPRIKKSIACRWANDGARLFDFPVAILATMSAPLITSGGRGPWLIFTYSNRVTNNRLSGYRSLAEAPQPPGPLRPQEGTSLLGQVRKLAQGRLYGWRCCAPLVSIAKVVRVRHLR
jgi:hypothetical protein